MSLLLEPLLTSITGVESLILSFHKHEAPVGNQQKFELCPLHCLWQTGHWSRRFQVKLRVELSMQNRENLFAHKHTTANWLKDNFLLKNLIVTFRGISMHAEFTGCGRSNGPYLSPRNWKATIPRNASDASGTCSAQLFHFPPLSPIHLLLSQVENIRG